MMILFHTHKFFLKQIRAFQYHVFNMCIFTLYEDNKDTLSYRCSIAHTFSVSKKIHVNFSSLFGFYFSCRGEILIFKKHAPTLIHKRGTCVLTNHVTRSLTPFLFSSFQSATVQRTRSNY